MKIKLLLLALFGFFLISGTVSAQNIRNSLVIGASASQIDGDHLAGFDKTGLVFGGSSNFKITDKFSFQPEILFLQKGSKTTAQDSLIYFKYRLNYVSIPVLVCYKVKPRFTLHAGLAIDYLLSAKVDNGGGYEELDREINKLDLNYTGGFEYQIWDNLAANMRYQYSVQWIKPQHFKNSNVLFTLRFLLGGGDN
jgi:opacity protein-like surface antigen